MHENAIMTIEPERGDVYVSKPLWVFRYSEGEKLGIKAAFHRWEEV